MLPVYIELVVHLRSKSSCSVIFSFLSNASEVKDGVAVPFCYVIRGNVSMRAGVRWWTADNFLFTILIGLVDKVFDQFLPLDSGSLEPSTREPRWEILHCEVPMMRNNSRRKEVTHRTGSCQPPKHLHR